MPGRHRQCPRGSRRDRFFPPRRGATFTPVQRRSLGVRRGRDRRCRSHQARHLPRTRALRESRPLLPGSTTVHNRSTQRGGVVSGLACGSPACGTWVVVVALRGRWPGLRPRACGARAWRGRCACDSGPAAPTPARRGRHGGGTGAGRVSTSARQLGVRRYVCHGRGAPVLPWCRHRAMLRSSGPATGRPRDASGSRPGDRAEQAPRRGDSSAGPRGRVDRKGDEPAERGREQRPPRRDDGTPQA